MNVREVVELLRRACSAYRFEPIAIYKVHGRHGWPLIAQNAEDLAHQLADGGHFLPLPKEPAALANIVEVAVVDYLIDSLASETLSLRRGTERGYPDLELRADDAYYAVDVKVARRGVTKTGKLTSRTDSRITLYTGNTFFMYPELKLSSILRPFGDYAGHIDIIGLYTLDADSPARVTDFELIVVEAWRVASKKRSSTTREYLGAVDSIDDLRNERGEFATQEDFYKFWRAHPWKIGRLVQQEFRKHLSAKKT